MAAGILDVDPGHDLPRRRGSSRGNEIHAAGRQSPQDTLLDRRGDRTAGAPDVNAELGFTRREPCQDDGPGTARCHQEAAAPGSLDLAFGAVEFQADRGGCAWRRC